MEQRILWAALAATFLLAGCASTGDAPQTHLRIESPDGTVTHDVPFDGDARPTADRFAADGASHPGYYTAFDQLEQSGVPYEAEGSEWGYFVTSLDGIDPSPDGYWRLIHNGEPAEEGVSSLRLAAGDTVTWTIGTVSWTTGSI